MLYLDALENRPETGPQNQFAICHEKVAGIPAIPELTPSLQLLEKWETRTIEWGEFQQSFKAELRKEYGKGDTSRLKGLANYCLQNEVILYSPEPPGEQTYRAILTEVINSIWERLGETDRAIDRAATPYSDNTVSKAHQQEMAEIADNCAHFEPASENRSIRSCLHCEHLDAHIYACKKLGKPVIQYKWS